MAEIYRQDWSAGASTFSTQDIFSTPFTGGTDSDAVYPEIVWAEGAEIGIGEGPSGENVVKWNGTHGTWQTTAVGIALSFSGNGRVTFKQYFSTAMLAVANYMPLFWMSYGAIPPDMTFGFSLATPGDPSVGFLDIGNQPGPDPTSSPIDFTPYENTWIDIDIAWTLGTPGGVTVKFNGSTLFTAAPSSLVTSGPTGVEVDTVAFGWDGLAGPLTDIVIEDTSDLELVTIFGEHTRVTATHAVAMGLDGDSHICANAHALTVYGDLFVSGAATLGGVAVGGGATPIALDDLSDVAIAGPSTFQVLTYSGSGWVNTNAIGFIRATGTIAHASILTLPTSVVDLLPAPGAGYWLQIHALVFQFNFSAGAYTNIDANAYVHPHSADWSVDIFEYLVNGTGGEVTTTGRTEVSDFFGAAAKKRWNVNRVVYGGTKFDAGWGGTVNADDPAAAANQPFVLAMDNMGAGNLTGGNAANEIKWVAHYTVESLS